MSGLFDFGYLSVRLLLAVLNVGWVSYCLIWAVIVFLGWMLPGSRSCLFCVFIVWFSVVLGVRFAPLAFGVVGVGCNLVSILVWLVLVGVYGGLRVVCFADWFWLLLLVWVACWYFMFVVCFGFAGLSLVVMLIVLFMLRWVIVVMFVVRLLDLAWLILVVWFGYCCFVVVLDSLVAWLVTVLYLVCCGWLAVNLHIYVVY